MSSRHGFFSSRYGKPAGCSAREVQSRTASFGRWPADSRPTRGWRRRLGSPRGKPIDGSACSPTSAREHGSIWPRPPGSESGGHNISESLDPQEVNISGLHHNYCVSSVACFLTIVTSYVTGACSASHKKRWIVRSTWEKPVCVASLNLRWNGPGLRTDSTCCRASSERCRVRGLFGVCRRRCVPAMPESLPVPPVAMF